MKRILFILVAVCATLAGNSQELVVKSFQVNENDLSARTMKRLDMNGNPCAIIKVEALPVCEFEGNIVGQVEKKYGAYWVYVSGNTKGIRISSDHFNPMDVKFSSYGINKAEFSTVYTLRIESQIVANNNIIDGHRYVDLGLSVFWAEMNVGASKITNAGHKYVWGLNLKNNQIAPKINEISGTKYDIATQLWGNIWRMPTEDDDLELYENTIQYNDIVNGVSGKRIVGPSGNSIFIPFEKLINDKNGNINENKATTLLSSSKTSYLIRTWPKVLFGECPSVIIFSQESIIVQDSQQSDSIGFVRPVINNDAYDRSKKIYGEIRNNRFLIKGQVIDDHATHKYPYAGEILVFDDKTNEQIYSFSNPNGLFEIWAQEGQVLRFESKNGEFSPEAVVVESTLMKVNVRAFRLG